MKALGTAVSVAILAWHMGCAQEQPPGYEAMREQMVAGQIEGRGVRDPRVLAALRKVPRHEFVPESVRAESYGDYPLPIGEGQTISQPYIVAYMTESLGLQPGDRVLEVGTGSGYQAAVLAELAAKVFTIEIIPVLGERAEATLSRLGYTNVEVRVGDGYLGWPEEAPFDAVIVTCAPDAIPRPLEEQLRDGGRMIIPVGEQGGVQELVLVEKKQGALRRERVMMVRFVPMVRRPQGKW